MIRQNRNRDKLVNYYNKFAESGEIDPNVHPWVAESWQKSRKFAITAEKFSDLAEMSKEELRVLQNHHKAAVEYMQDFTDGIRDFLQEYDLCLLLLDNECNILKNYSSPYNRLLSKKIEGANLKLENVGTFSANIAAKYKSMFWMFGPEIWLKAYHDCDTGAAPVCVCGETAYIITVLSRDYEKLPQDAVISLLMSIKTAMEIHLKQKMFLQAQEAILDATPFAVYHILKNGDVAYTNKLGASRLAGIGAIDEQAKTLNLNEVVLNYRHTPIYKGFSGISCINQEVTWTTQVKTYEDITTVVPIKEEDAGENDEVKSVVAVTMPIEDLRMLVAHAAGYTAKYSLDSIVGISASCSLMKERAVRAAKKDNHILLQGEPGTGKQRLAHGIHMAGSRSNGPLISINCGDVTPELLEQELFGARIGQEISHPGKLELASGGTLLMDEIEKLPPQIAEKLAQSLQMKKILRIGEDVERTINVRIIASSDGNLRRLCEKNLFDEKLFEIVSRSIIHLPPLRSRREDIPLLTESILTELTAQHKTCMKKLTGEAIDMLAEYDWPGNIKQLQGVIENAVFTVKDDTINADSINLMGNIRPDSKWKEDKDIFIRAWQSAGGNVSRLANLLGVSRVTLYRYIKKYGVEK
ncbi:sigma 54-interacting transcriptional regulator [Pectinatus haikarae]|uniref:Transcriptional regulator with PAS, ATPase and Fis domain n=2 Tax=Pectinatus haikarae TaxID=349096 RepID=A0ABT9YA27_9FIRM|nr:sigma 54-interacting transcriptional regulator [Pectinatus haikarae]MDQ0204695.1 transcriptional regulator with PAS, ATPase and Fis domain [Pectinatus haikarae]